jgi:metallophosphoesterase (TIGR00282 family)
MTVLFVGDIVGKLGRRAMRRYLEERRLGDHEGEPTWDIVIANGENVAGGLGITPALVEELLGQGVDAITLGNHSWSKRDLIDYADSQPRLIRPANHPPGAPGFGFSTIESASGGRLAVVNLNGRVFMDFFDCPFRTMDHLLESSLPADVPVLVDLHAEATAEKLAMLRYLDGRVAALIGTHTHVATADAHVTEKGTAYITDVGMTGPVDSVIGMKAEVVLHRFLTRMPVKFDVQESGPYQFCGAEIDIDPVSRCATSIRRLEERYGG